MISAVGGQQSREGAGLQEASAEGGPGQLQGSSGVHALKAAMAAAEGEGVLPQIRLHALLPPVTCNVCHLEAMDWATVCNPTITNSGR